MIFQPKRVVANALSLLAYFGFGIQLLAQAKSAKTAESIDYVSLLALLTVLGLAGFAISRLSNRAQEKTKESGESIIARQVLFGAKDAVFVIDEAGLIDSLNPAAERMFGYPEGKIKGQSIATLIPPPDRGRRRANYIQNPGSHELVGIHQNGDRVAIESSCSEIQGGPRKLFSLIIRDITDTRNKQASINFQQNLLGEILRNAGILLFVIDREGKIVHFNRACENLTEFSFGEIKDGICTYRYDEYLAERLYDPEIYATINMSIQRQFQSGYALTLYENCLRYKDVGSTGWWDLEKFRRVMGASATFYDEFKYLQRDVIKGPVRQVNETSDIRIEPDFERQARKVTKIRFLITDPLQKSLVSKKDIDADAEIRNSDIFKQLSEHGIGEALAIDWIRSEPARIVAIIADVEAKHRQGKVKSTGGYITQMVKIGATPGATVFEKKKRESQLARVATQQQSVNQEEQEQERVQQDLLRAEQWLESQSPDTQKLTVEAWFDQANEFEKRNYKKNPDGIVSRKNIARHILKSNVMDR